MSIALAMILIVMALAYGVWIGWLINFVPRAKHCTEPKDIPSVHDTREQSEAELVRMDAELTRIEAERQRLAEDNKAFQAMLDYNVSVAYGMAKDDERER